MAALFAGAWLGGIAAVGVGVGIAGALGLACGGTQASSSADGGSDGDGGIVGPSGDGSGDGTDAGNHPDSGKSADAGNADAASDAGTDDVRAVLALAPHDMADLDALVGQIYDPTSATFRQYIAQTDLLTLYAPTQSDVDAVTAWLTSQSLTVAHVATDRLLIEVHGSQASFNRAFQSTLVLAAAGNNKYLFATPITIPASLSSILVSVLSPDALAAPGGPPPDTGTVQANGPASPTSSFLTKDIAGAYDATGLYSAGVEGAGVAIGIVGTGGGRPSDLQTFWMGQAITRQSPRIVTVTDPSVAFSTEATLDLEWSGSLAPASDLVFYEAADNHDGSLLFAMNEAVGRREVDIVSDSFSHHESVVPIEIRAAYEVIGEFAAAMGQTLFSASGDSNVVDFPGSSQWWTAVGGTNLTLASDGTVASEVAWSFSGCGVAATEPAPPWQATAVFGANGKRAVVDLSVQANSLFYVHEGAWEKAGGTSFASPTMAGLMALVNSSRVAAGQPKVGYLNSILYGTPALQATMRDITSGTSGANAAQVGWDYPTGFGAIDAAAFAAALP